MDKKRILIPLAIGGAVIGIYFLLRRNGPTPIYSQPNTSQSGASPLWPSVAPLIAQAAQPVTPPTLNFQNSPSNTGPSNQFSVTGPFYDYAKQFSFNFPMLNLGSNGNPQTPATNPTPFSAPPSTESGCGCGSCMSCISTSNSNFPDGRGGCMAASQSQQISQALPNGIQANTPAGQWADIINSALGDPSSLALTEVNNSVQTNQGGTPAGPNPTWGNQFVPQLAAS